ncbi:hypothetical protein CEXT_129131 [Caerostris extrusa]|uniref:Uncharacterized protein n=1 Tax=Caerostris extrusa TaxID=172846 RepID=A0AAV4UES9_CAEEX|nr:hypothetical protein CEXT_129131 [Caerostris extrusa]
MNWAQSRMALCKVMTNFRRFDTVQGYIYIYLYIYGWGAPPTDVGVVLWRGVRIKGGVVARVGDFRSPEGMVRGFASTCFNGVIATAN